jgi:hypothetical protein
MYISILHLFVLDVLMTLVPNADDYGYHNQEPFFPTLSLEILAFSVDLALFRMREDNVLHYCSPRTLVLLQYLMLKPRVSTGEAHPTNMFRNGVFMSLSSKQANLFIWNVAPT